LKEIGTFKLCFEVVRRNLHGGGLDADQELNQDTSPSLSLLSRTCSPYIIYII